MQSKLGDLGLQLWNLDWDSEQGTGTVVTAGTVTATATGTV